MCHTAFVINNKCKAYCNNIGELSNATGIRPSKLPMIRESERPEERHHFTWDECLCWVDFEKLGELTGLVVTKHGWDDNHCGEWELSSPS